MVGSLSIFGLVCGVMIRAVLGAATYLSAKLFLLHGERDLHTTPLWALGKVLGTKTVYVR